MQRGETGNNVRWGSPSWEHGQHPVESYLPNIRVFVSPRIQQTRAFCAMTLDTKNCLTLWTGQSLSMGELMYADNLAANSYDTTNTINGQEGIKAQNQATLLVGTFSGWL